MMVSFKGAHFVKDIILTCVRWYVAYPLSYRQVEELMQERGVSVDHATINLWVLKYSSPLEAAFHRRKRPVRCRSSLMAGGSLVELDGAELGKCPIRCAGRPCAITGVSLRVLDSSQPSHHQCDHTPGSCTHVMCSRYGKGIWILR
jgi:hypothetical protein